MNIKNEEMSNPERNKKLTKELNEKLRIEKYNIYVKFY